MAQVDNNKNYPLEVDTNNNDDNNNNNDDEEQWDDDPLAAPPSPDDAAAGEGEETEPQKSSNNRRQHLLMMIGSFFACLLIGLGIGLGVGFGLDKKKNDDESTTPAPTSSSPECNESYTTNEYKYSVSFEGEATNMKLLEFAFRQAYDATTKANDDACSPMLQKVVATIVPGEEEKQDQRLLLLLRRGLQQESNNGSASPAPAVAPTPSSTTIITTIIAFAVTAQETNSNPFLLLPLSNISNNEADPFLQAMNQALANGSTMGITAISIIPIEVVSFSQKPTSTIVITTTPSPTTISPTQTPIPINCSTTYWNISDPPNWNASEVFAPLEQTCGNTTTCTTEACGYITAVLYHVLPVCSRWRIDDIDSCQHWAKQMLIASYDGPGFYYDESFAESYGEEYTLYGIRERYALMVFYCELDGPHWSPQSTQQFEWIWTPPMSRSLCHWFLSPTDDDYDDDDICNDDGQLLRLRFTGGNDLGGTLPPDLAILTSLQELSLSSSQIFGPIPDCYKQLKYLQKLDLSANQLSGRLPSFIWKYDYLKYLDLSFNCLRGSLPNQRLDAAIDAVLWFDGTYEYVKLSQTQLYGSIPSDFEQHSFVQLHLDGTGLTGTVPKLNLSRTEELYLHQNDLRGELNWNMFDGALNLSEFTVYLNEELTADINDICKYFDIGNLKVAQVDKCNIACDCCGNGDNAGCSGWKPTWPVCGPYMRPIDPILPPSVILSTGGMCYDAASSSAATGPTQYDDSFYDFLDSVNVGNNNPVTAWDAPVGRCEWSNKLQPHFEDQCDCDDQITIVAEDIESAYEKLKANFVSPLYREMTGTGVDDIPITSCDALNKALLWLASNGNDGDPLQRYVLAVLHFSLGGKNWRCQSDWLSRAHECNWYGVGCEGNQITSLNFSPSRVGGQLPEELQFLPGLISLSITDGYLFGTIPTGLFGLPKLSELRLSANKISGHIPTEVGQATALKILELGHNLVGGSIPSQIGLCTQLTILQVHENAINGTLPTSIGQLTNLEYISLNNNLWTGKIPSELGYLTALRELHFAEYDFNAYWVHYHTISGRIPSEVGLLSQLEVIDFVGQHLSGFIPSEMGMLSKLSYLSITNMDHTGQLPSQIGLLTSLVRLNLRDTHLSGELPSQLGLLTAMAELNLYGTDLVSSIPSQLCSLRKRELERFLAPCPSEGGWGVGSYPVNRSRDSTEGPNCFTSCNLS